MASQIDKHIFTDPDGHRVVVALLSDGGIRVRFEGDRKTAVTFHATGNKSHSVTIITPQAT